MLHSFKVTQPRRRQRMPQNTLYTAPHANATPPNQQLMSAATTHEAGNRQGRGRITIACGRCRKRKIRCSGIPKDGVACEGCKAAGVEPSFCQFFRVGTVRVCSDLPASPSPLQEELCLPALAIPTTSHSSLSYSHEPSTLGPYYQPYPDPTFYAASESISNSFMPNKMPQDVPLLPMPMGYDLAVPYAETARGVAEPKPLYSPYETYASFPTLPPSFTLPTPWYRTTTS